MTTPTNRLEAIEARIANAVDYNESHRVYTERGASPDHWIYGYGSHDIPADLAWAVARIRELTELVAKKDAVLRDSKDFIQGRWPDVECNAIDAALALRVDAGEMK